MFVAIDTKPSCARAWVAAASRIASEGEAYNVVLDVDDPTKFDVVDNAVISLVDSFLREHGQNPVITVANTIFPQALYQKHGSPAFFRVYHEVIDRLTSSKKWGRYFDRMTRHVAVERNVDRSTRRVTLEQVEYNPLEELIAKLREQAAGDHQYKAVYELAIYDPLLDRRYLRGGQCLSLLSFKLHPERGLALTAVYRNQTYITRCLGNLIGLGRLQAFIAGQAKVAVGPLTCVSTHAELDVGEGWGLRDARRLVEQAAEIVAEPVHRGGDAALVAVPRN